MATDTAFELSLPSGGGSMAGIGETFQANAFAGTANFSIPLAVTPGRSGFSPALALRYSSGTGNGPFGLGWTLDLPSIARRTEKGLPNYDEGDTFVLSGDEELVPARRRSAAGPDAWIVETESVGTFRVERFRPRVEKRFSRIERWTDPQGDVHWRVTTRDNVTSLYGRTASARVSDPDSPRRTFRWLIEETFDRRGNHMLYEYALESPPPHPLLHEKGRRATAQRYLRRILYANAPASLPRQGLPLRTATDHVDPLARRERQYLLEVLVDYGDVEGTAYREPSPAPGRERADDRWTLREDPFSSCRPGFELRTLRLCRRIMMFHHFSELGGARLVRATELAYRVDADSRLTFLTGAEAVGYAESGAESRLPPLALGYTPFEPEQRQFSTLAADEGFPPRRIFGRDVAFVDVFGNGLPSVVQSNLGGWRCWRNLGGGRFAPPSVMEPSPVGATLARPGIGIGDVQGDGYADLLDHSSPLPGFYPLRRDGHWGEFRPYRNLTSVDLADRNLRLVDLTGDGRSDALISAPESFIWFECEGEKGFAPPRRVARLHDLDLFPDVSFDDPDGRVRLADMNGDGLADIVHIHDGAIEYWPNLGHGRFGPRVRMSNAPRLGSSFDPARLFLVDLDGSGAADLVYVEFDRVRFWRNQSGNGWGAERVVTGTPPTTAGVSVDFIDVFGTGTATLVWSYEFAPQPAGASKALDFCGGVKPNMLCSLDNGMGGVTNVRLVPSTRFYLADRAAGRSWKTSLPFPVHVLEEVEVVDRIGGTRLVTRYAYHHGCWDGREREFRGFACVDRFDAESFADPTAVDAATAYRLPPTLTRTWYHPGMPVAAVGSVAEEFDVRRAFASEFYAGDSQAFTFADTGLDPAADPAGEPREALRALGGIELRTETYALDGTSLAGDPYTVSEGFARVECLQPPTDIRPGVYLATRTGGMAYVYERDATDPRMTQNIIAGTDAFGNPVDHLQIAYPRRNPSPDCPEQAALRVLYERFDYINSTTRGAYHIGLSCQARRYEVTGVPWPGNAGAAALAVADFAAVLADPDDFDDYDSAPAVGAAARKRLVDWRRVYFKRDSAADALDPVDSLASRLALGSIEPLGLTYETYEAAFTDGQVRRVFGTRLDGLAAPARGGYHPHAAVAGAEPGAAGYRWIGSGRRAFDPQNFYLATASADPFGTPFTAALDRYALLTTSITDPAGNVTAVDNDYRVLKPSALTDANGNLRRVAFDGMGFVSGVAEMGKQSGGSFEGDSLDDFVTDLDDTAIDAYFANPAAEAPALLGTATSRIIYDYGRLVRVGEPPAVITLARAHHGARAAAETICHTIHYADGFGHDLQIKTSAEPDSGAPGVARWVGSGAKIYNNKGKVVRQFEPFFSATPGFGLEERGANSTLFLDPLQRIVGAHHSDETYRKFVYTPWRIETWDANDTVLLDPRTDPDVRPFAASFFARYDAEFAAANGAPPPTWYAENSAATANAQQIRAASCTALHAGTPIVGLLDPQGRAVREFRDTGTETIRRRVEWDIEGQDLRHHDSQGRTTLHNVYDLKGRRLAFTTLDTGTRLTFPDVAGKPVFHFDADENRIETHYDSLRRVVETWVTKGAAAPRLATRTAYGEGAPRDQARNLRGRIFSIHDEAGVELHDRYDFKGNLETLTRQFVGDHRIDPDWSAAPALDGEIFRVASRYDALNRVVEKTHARDGAAESYRHLISYCGPSLVDAVRLEAPGLPISPLIEGITYDAQGRRTFARLGNGVTLAYTYDARSLRLARLEATRPDGTKIQDLAYSFDPFGNVMSILDAAADVVFNRNARVESLATYTYDAIYRLTQATGREHADSVRCDKRSAGMAGPFVELEPTQGRADAQALVTYTQSYGYDVADNLISVAHRNSRGDGWTRTQTCAVGGNRLAESDSGCPGERGFAFPHDASGRMLAMAHVRTLDWNEMGRLRSVTLPGSTGGINDRVVYRHSFEGQRARKVVERAGEKVEERFYLGGFEIYRRYAHGTIALERETLHASDGKQPVAEIDRRTIPRGVRASDPDLAIRYTLSNHLGSAVTELDAGGETISVEEYYPFGGTAYSIGAERLGAKAKRYRYAGKERDEETGLYYYGARYYAPWLGRWISPDSVEVAGGANLYVFVANNPIGRVDPWGLAPQPVSSVQEGLDRLGSAVQAERQLARSSPDYQPVEHALIRTEQGALQVIRGEPGGINVPEGATALAHTHPNGAEYPTNLDMQVMVDSGLKRHAIVLGEKKWALIENIQGKWRASVFENGKFSYGCEIKGWTKPDWDNPVVEDAQMSRVTLKGQGTQAGTKYQLATLLEKETGAVPAGSGRIASPAAAAEGVEVAAEVSRFKATVTTVKNAAGTIGRGAATVATWGGRALSALQIADGVSDIADGKTAEGANKAGFGTANLALDVGGGFAVKSGAIVVGGGSAALFAVTAAAGGSLFLAQQTIDAAINGEKAPYEVASDYWIDKALVWTGHEP